MVKKMSSSSYSTIAQASSFTADPPPSYVEAIKCEQLSSRQLTLWMVDQQQNNSATTANGQMKDFAKEKKDRKIYKLICVFECFSSNDNQ